MALLLKATKAITDRLPSVISPGVHAIIDYATAGVLFAGAAYMWRQHRPAAVAALVTGIAETTVAALTDYPGGVVRKIPFETHGRIDVGLTLMTATMPEFLRFDDAKEARLFDIISVQMAAVAGLTDFTGSGEAKQLQRLEKQAA